jgi:hypothetical protein
MVICIYITKSQLFSQDGFACVDAYCKTGYIVYALKHEKSAQFPACIYRNVLFWTPEKAPPPNFCKGYFDSSCAIDAVDAVVKQNDKKQKLSEVLFRNSWTF